MKDLERIGAFLTKARALYTTYRFTPKPDGGFENDAEHSWAVAFTCMTLASRLKEEHGDIDMEKVLKMALIHDIAEIVTGDVKTWDVEGRKNKEENERAAMEQLLSELPDDIRIEFNDLWEECEAKESIEAKIVKSVDRFDPVIHRTVFDLGWEELDAEIGTIEHLDGRQLPRHSFSQTLTNMYTHFRDIAIKKMMLK